MLHQPELHGATERFLIEDAVAWQPLAPGALDAVADLFDRLGPDAAIARYVSPSGRGTTVTVRGERAGIRMVGQGRSFGEALRALAPVRGAA